MLDLKVKKLGSLGVVQKMLLNDNRPSLIFLLFILISIFHIRNYRDVGAKSVSASSYTYKNF